MTEDRAGHDLRRLATSYGVQPFYRDNGGTKRVPSAEALLAMVRALGEGIETVGEATAALAARRARLADRRVEPVAVAWERERSTLRVTMPEGCEQVGCRLRLEGGKALSWKRDLERLAVVGRCRGSDGVVLTTRHLPLPRDLPRGYHRLRVTCGERSDDCLLIVAPCRVYDGEDGLGDGREWGAFLPLYALRDDGGEAADDGGLGDLGVGDFGVGDFSGLERLGRWVGGLGGSTVATLPLLAAFLYGDDPFEYSPYGPASRLFWNELYVDPRRLPELERSPAAGKLLASAAFRREIAALAAEPLIDYRRVAAVKRRLLEPLAAAFFADDAPAARREALEELRRRRPEVDDYAAFRATVEHRAAPWQRWPGPARAGTLTAVEDGGDDYLLDDQRFHLYAQLAADEQVAAAAETLRGNGGGLYLDLPVGVHPASYDVWSEQELFVTTASAGAPPDALFTGGQDWGLYPLHPERQREQGYRHLVAVLRHHFQQAGMLRIDHVMQLHRLYVIPHGVDKNEGVYLRYPSEELYAILALESHRTRTRVVGENLGTVPPYVGRALSRHGIWKTYVLPFAVDTALPGGLLARPVADDEVASLNTHDMPTFRAFWEGTDVADRLAMGWIDDEGAAAERRRREEERARWRRALWSAGHLGPEDGDEAVLAAALAYLGEGDSPLVLASLEDLWRERQPQNVPGTGHERPNWRRRAALTLAEMAADRRVTGVLERLDAARRGDEAPPPLPPEERPEEPEREVPAAAPEAVLRVGGIVAAGAARRLTDDDLHLFNEGRHFRLYDKLGAHRGELDGAAGYHFGVWAPDAEGVSVVGDFNGWDRDAHPLVARGSSGIWEGFLPGALPGQNYKFHVRARFSDYRVDKADPFAQRSELPPKTGSVLWHRDYEWGDDAWLERRGRLVARDAPVSIYEVHLGSWRRVPEEGNRSLSYREIAAPLADHVERCGFTHVELLPVMEHPFYGSWGYQTTGYFTPTARYGTPQDLMYLVDYLHQRGIGVLLDWVPSHFPSDEHALGYFDGTHLFEHSDPRLGYHPDWNSFIFNYARHEVRSFLISSALFWLDAFHADGIRVDAVASMLYRDYSRREGEWIPNAHGGRENLEAIDFLRQLNAAVYAAFPGVETFAEESTAWPGVSRPVDAGGLGFGYKWDMGWMHDTLSYMQRPPVHRRYHQNELTFRSVYAFSESFCLPLSHDEVVHGKGSLVRKMPGDDWQKLANLRLLYGYMWLQPAKKLLFMGGELGQWTEWAHESSLDWHLLGDERHAGLVRWIGDLNRLYRDEPALHQLDCDPAGFEWVDASDHGNSVLAFLRRGEDGDDGTLLLAVFNFTPQPHHGYRFGVPRGGRWEEVLNGDGADYGGSGVGNQGAVEAVEEGHDGRPFALDLTLPPLAMVVLRSAAPSAPPSEPTTPASTA